MPPTGTDGLTLTRILEPRPIPPGPRFAHTPTAKGWRCDATRHAAGHHKACVGFGKTRREAEADCRRALNRAGSPPRRAARPLAWDVALSEAADAFNSYTRTVMRERGFLRAILGPYATLAFARWGDDGKAVFRVVSPNPLDVGVLVDRNGRTMEVVARGPGIAILVGYHQPSLRVALAIDEGRR